MERVALTTTILVVAHHVSTVTNADRILSWTPAGYAPSALMPSWPPLMISTGRVRGNQLLDSPSRAV